MLGDHSPLHEELPSTSGAFGHWKSAYGQLISTLDSFRQECINLDLVLQQSGTRQWPELEDSLLYVDYALTSLETSYLQVHGTLGTVRNRSRSLIPFNKLPPELLVSTLSLVDTECILDQQHTLNPKTRQPIPRLASIMIASKHLRDISTTAPPLWTHIDLVIGSPHEEIYMRYASACLRYSGRLHLQVHIVENQTKRIPQTAGLVGLLAPHADRIASLDLQISAPLAREIMLGLFSHPALYQLRGLCLSDGDCNFDPEFCDRFFEGHLGESLRSLQALAVLGPLVPLDSPAYHGLTVLKLVPQKLGMFHPTLLQLAGALEGSPKLRSLSLIGCTFQAISDASIQPVSLPDLELLDLRRIRANQLLDLISSIALGSKKLAFSMSFDPEMARHDITTLQHFLQNSKITRLCIHNTLNDGNLNWLFRVPADVLARVHELALDHYNFMHGQVEARALGVDRFPLLHTLHLLGCRLDLNRCRQLLDSSTIQVLQTEQVHYYKDLSGVVPHVKYRQYAAICQGEGDLEWPVYAI